MANCSLELNIFRQWLSLVSSGDWKDNKRTGKGVFTWADGSIYNGDWENDAR
jgi:MORN repeat